jgi:TATA-box binding protein (TBP) (component of TFIID and TFIIIB)
MSEIKSTLFSHDTCFSFIQKKSSSVPPCIVAGNMRFAKQRTKKKKKQRRSSVLGVFPDPVEITCIVCNAYIGNILDESKLVDLDFVQRVFPNSDRPFPSWVVYMNHPKYPNASYKISPSGLVVIRLEAQRCILPSNLVVSVSFEAALFCITRLVDKLNRYALLEDKMHLEQLIQTNILCEFSLGQALNLQAFYHKHQTTVEYSHNQCRWTLLSGLVFLLYPCGKVEVRGALTKEDAKVVYYRKRPLLIRYTVSRPRILT